MFIALSGCARAPGLSPTPVENDPSIIFPVSTGQGLVTVGGQGKTYQLDGEVLRALRIVEQDLFPAGASERPCWARPEAHTYRFTRQGDIIFVYVEEDLAYCHRQAPAMDSGAKYAISVDGRILRRVIGSEPDHGVWRLKTPEGGTVIVITEPGVVPGPSALQTPDSGIVRIVTEPVDMPGVVILERPEGVGEAREAEPGVIPGLTMLPADAGVRWEYLDGGLMAVPQPTSLPLNDGDGGVPR
ncbi:hypothetical protein [Hyalangium gracile]|uniref:hypothetical protein n=1 Tax=Hyalangium gracile TaxID=394092 RepID=UPI001CCFA0AD|nr:hypothetical protein [Hyalangium gracile]